MFEESQREACSHGGRYQDPIHFEKPCGVPHALTCLPEIAGEVHIFKANRVSGHCLSEIQHLEIADLDAVQQLRNGEHRFDGEVVFVSCFLYLAHARCRGVGQVDGWKEVARIPAPARSGERLRLTEVPAWPRYSGRPTRTKQ